MTSLVCAIYDTDELISETENSENRFVVAKG